jgi:hypothetical protein
VRGRNAISATGQWSAHTPVVLHILSFTLSHTNNANNEYESNQHRPDTVVHPKMHTASTAASGFVCNDTMLSCTAGAQSRGLHSDRDGRSSSSSSSSRARQPHQLQQLELQQQKTVTQLTGCHLTATAHCPAACLGCGRADRRHFSQRLHSCTSCWHS